MSNRKDSGADATKKEAPAGTEALSKSQAHSNISGNSAHAQRARLLAALREHPVTTLQARKELDILHPAGRAMELRKRGYNIVTAWTYAETKPNKLHRIGRYCLLPKKAKGAK